MTKYKRIYDELSSRIAKGEYSNGAKLPTENELTKAYRVSRPTVNKALNLLRDDGYVVRRPGAGSFVTITNRHQATTNNGRKLQFGLAVPRAGEIFEPIAHGIIDSCHDRGYALTLVGTNSAREGNALERLEKACNQFVRDKFDGVFLFAPELTLNMQKMNQRLSSLFEKNSVPLILLDSDFVPFPDRTRFDLVGIDNIRSGYRAAKHFIDQGATRIDFFHRPFSAYTIDARIRGYHMAMRDENLSPDRTWCHEGDPGCKDDVERLLSSGATNIICANDITATELMHTISKLGVMIPRDIRIIGFDDVMFARLARVPLTTFRQPRDQIAMLALEAMLYRIQQPEADPLTIQVEASIVVRESSIIHPTEPYSPAAHA